MQKRVLITGGSGLLGSKITKKLLENKFSVAYLSTRKDYKKKNVDVFYWNPSEAFMDVQALEGVDVIIHLAGAGIADKRWTEERKKEILDSRVQSTNLIIQTLKQNVNSVKQVIGASAIGYYGNSKEVLHESAPCGSDFLAEVCKDWEEAYALEETQVLKTIFRIGIVLAEDGGALKEMTKTLPFFVGILGDGKQYYSWIHIDDLAAMFIHAIEKENFEGIFNAVAPAPASQKKIAQTIAHLNNTVSIPAPKFALKIALGEMSSMLFLNQNCSADKILSTGFKFRYPNLKQALEDLN